MINHQFHAKCESHRASLAGYRDFHQLQTERQKAERYQVQSLIMRIVIIKKMLICQLQQMYYPKVKTLIGIRW